MTGAKVEAMKTGIVLALPAGTTVNVSWQEEVACCPMATRATGDRAFGSLYRGEFHMEVNHGGIFFACENTNPAPSFRMSYG